MPGIDLKCIYIFSAHRFCPNYSVFPVVTIIMVIIILCLKQMTESVVAENVQCEAVCNMQWE